MSNITVGGASQFASLQMLQIVTSSSTTNFTTSSTSFTNSNLSVSITPKLSTSKVLVFATGYLVPSTTFNMYATIARGGTNLFAANGAAQAQANYISDMNIMFYDSPATTSATTYSLQVKTDGNSCTFGATNVTQYIVAIEVAQ